MRLAEPETGFSVHLRAAVREGDKRAMPISDADRKAAEALRVILADISGFWHGAGDDSALCQALARHREAAEERAAAKFISLSAAKPSGAENIAFERMTLAAPALRRRRRAPPEARFAE